MNNSVLNVVQNNGGIQPQREGKNALRSFIKSAGYDETTMEDLYQYLLAFGTINISLQCAGELAQRLVEERFQFKMSYPKSKTGVPFARIEFYMD